MIEKEDFGNQVSNAYQHLYDFVRLRNHPLTSMVITDQSIEQKERGWLAHRMLLDVITELDPGASAPPYSKEWRRYRLMELRYIEAMDPQSVADQLAISRRQYYREHATAIEAVADLLWERYRNIQQPAPAFTEDNGSTDAIQRELARFSQNDAYASLSEVIEGAVAVLRRVLEQNDIEIDIVQPEERQIVSISRNLLRQVLLGALGHLVESAAGSRLRIEVAHDDTIIHLRLAVIEGSAPDPFEFEGRLEDLREMLQIVSIPIELLYINSQPVGFMLDLPLEYDQTVLVADDNEDTLTLFKRYLAPNHYRVITTTSSQSVLRLAQTIQPDVVVVDLMMPERDGWDLLQSLTNRPATAHIPVVVCSVLKQRDLALSLGAAAYLPKPFTEQALISVLKSVHD